MEIRKEQALFIGTALILGLFVLSADDRKAPRGRRAAKKAWTSSALAPEVTVGGREVVAKPKRDAFVEPSVVKALPPLEAPELPMPGFPELPIVLPRNRHDVDAEHWYLRRMTPTQIADLVGESAGAGGSNRGDTSDASSGARTDATLNGSGNAQDEGTDNDDEVAWARSWDQLRFHDGTVHWGKVLTPNPFRLGQPDPDEVMQIRGPFASVKVLNFRKVKPSTGRVSIPNWGIEAEQLANVEWIRFASTLGNRLEMRTRRIPAGDTGLGDLEDLILELIVEWPRDPEVFEVAERLALSYIERNPASSRGQELLCYVFAWSGQPDKELSRYRELMQGQFKDEPFIYRGLGRLEWRLGLDEQAEQHLRDAVRKGIGDPISRRVLARFLCAKGRTREALEHSDRSVKGLPPGMRESEAFACWAVHIHCLLGVGDVERASRSLVPAGGYTGGKEDHAPLALLRALVQHAQGKHAEAETAFELASLGLEDTVEAPIGQALAAFRQGDAERALGIVESGLSRDPLERHRVIVAKAFLLGARGDLATAVEQLRLAQTMAPGEPYLLYLLGRYLRRTGVFDEATDLLQVVLQRQPELVEVLAEQAKLLLDRAVESSDPGERASLLSRAERFANKVCEIEAGRAREWKYQDLLGVVRYHLGQNEAARTAFKQSKEWGSDGVHSGLYLALLDYRAGRQDEALSQFARIRKNLPQESPYKDYVQKLIDLIRWHGNLRAYEDDFERAARLEQRYLLAGAPKPSQRDGAVQMRFKSNGKPVVLSRALEKGTGSLYEAQVRATIGEDSTATFIGFRLTNQRPRDSSRGKGRHFDYRIGYEDGLRVHATQGSGRKKGLPDLREQRDGLAARGFSWKPGETHLLGVRIERPKESGSQTQVVFLFDGQELARFKSSALGSARGDLHLQFLVESERGLSADARFDDFRFVYSE